MTPTMTDTFYVREMYQNPSRSEPEHPSPTESHEKKKLLRKTHCQAVETICACQALPRVASPKRPKSALRAQPECATAWYRRSVPNRGTTSAHPRAGWVGSPRNPQPRNWSLLECAAHDRSSQCGTRGFPGFTANPANTHLVPPGVCGAWPLLAVWDPRFSWAHRQPAIPINLPQHIARRSST